MLDRFPLLTNVIGESLSMSAADDETTSRVAASDITLSVSSLLRRKAETESGKFGDGKNTHWHMNMHMKGIIN